MWNGLTTPQGRLQLLFTSNMHLIGHNVLSDGEETAVPNARHKYSLTAEG